MPDLNGKVALVTGAGRGIGRGCARQLALAGADLVVNDRPGSSDLSSTVEELGALRRRCHGVEADVFTRPGCERLVSEAISLAGRIDILVSNVAWSSRSTFLECDPETFERTTACTFVAGFHLSQLVARHLVGRREAGKLLFISSVQAEMPMAGTVAYGAAKAALNQMMRTIAVELSPHRINVNAIEPGWIDTPGEREHFSDEFIQREGDRLPWGRLGLPDEIGKAAAFLVSDDAGYVTGSVLVVDGGFRFKDCVAAGSIEPQSSKDASGAAEA
ncbi:MAG: SDR family oxidoreductase [Planctomycetaceae bacterium]